MKKYVVPVLLTILLVMQAVSMTTIRALRNDLEQVNRQLSQVATDQSGTMNQIYHNIDTLLKQQASIIDSYDYTVGDGDRESLTVPVTVRLTPKETRTGTVATLYLSGMGSPMEKEGTTFRATVPVDIFEPLEARVVFTEDGMERSETLVIRENLRERLVPSLFAHFEGQAGYQFPQGQAPGVYERKGHLNLEIKSSMKAEFQKISLVMETDGKTVSETPMENVLGQRFPIDEETALYKGQTSAMLVVAVDSLGLVHRLKIDEVTIDEDAQPVFGDSWGMVGEATILDQEGRILYNPQEGPLY